MQYTRLVICGLLIHHVSQMFDLQICRINNGRMPIFMRHSQFAGEIRGDFRDMSTAPPSRWRWRAQLIHPPEGQWSVDALAAQLMVPIQQLRQSRIDIDPSVIAGAVAGPMPEKL